MIVVETESRCRVILINTNQTCIGMGSNQGLRSDSPLTNHVNQDKASMLPKRPPGVTSSYLYILEVPSEESWDRVAPAVLLVPIPSFSFGCLQSPPQWGSTQSV